MRAVLAALLLTACGPGRADYERLERRIEALEARAREEQAARAAEREAAERAAAPPDSKEQRARKMLAELQLIGRPAPPLNLDRWAQGRGDVGPQDTALVVFFDPAHPDTAEGVAKFEGLSRGRKGLEVLGVARGDGVPAWLGAHPVGFPVALDDGAVAEAWHRTAPVSAALVKRGTIVWTGTAAGFDEKVLEKHL